MNFIFKLFCLFMTPPFIIFATTEKCSFEACPETKPDMLNVHLICHTHDDLGWLKTVDQYFWGTNQSINKNGVQYILNTVVSELIQDPLKKFSYAETGFLWMWWDLQSDEIKMKVKRLVNEGQLEFIGGGYGQHDEASPHYTGIIDQMTIGHKFLNETFGRCGVSKVAWQIDPFGHSRETASLFAQMGLDALFLGRIHYLDRINRLKNKSLEMIWHGSDDIGSSSDILTSAFYDFYTPPSGFCFDELCDDDPLVDDSSLPTYNLPTKVQDFLNLVKQQSTNFSTNNIMVMMGSDFTYMNANRWFVNLDKLIYYINIMQSKGSKINVFYSTPTCYAQALYNSQIKFPEKSDDFFPHANDVHSYWTGYFTSRPTFKGYIRNAGNVLQVCQALESFAHLSNHSGDINILHIFSGCAKQHVTNDYSKRISDGIYQCQKIFNSATIALSKKQSDDDGLCFTFCNSLNITICNVSRSSEKFLVTVYNGLSKNLHSFVRIPINGPRYYAFDFEGNKTNAQVIKSFYTRQLPDPHQAPYELVLPVEINPLGYATYFIKKDSVDEIPSENVENDKPMSKCKHYHMKNEYLSVTFDSCTGLLQSVTELISKTKTKIEQNFYWYRGMDNSVKNSQPSGAFIFRPNGTKPSPISACHKCIHIVKIGKEGDLVQEIRQKFSNWISQTVRLYKGRPYVEFQWIVGPIPFKDNISREIITRFDSDIQSGGSFYTDSNGRQMMERRRNFQPTYQYNNSEPVSGNYYPISSHIYIKDHSKMLTILTDRGQGGSSMKEGSIEIMFSGLTKPLPSNVNVLTISKWRDDKMLLRLEHLFQGKDDYELSRPATIDMKDLFTSYEVTGAKEVTLSASRILDVQNISSEFSITLNPTEIRTFIVNVKNKID